MGKKGEAIMFVAPREKRLLHAIEKATNQKIELMKLPTAADINVKRIERFKDMITQTLDSDDIEQYAQIIDQYRIETNVPSLEIAAALAILVQGDNPLLVKHKKETTFDKPLRDNDYNDTRRSNRRDNRGEKQRRQSTRSEIGMETYKILVGNSHGVKPSNIVGAIANEVELDSKHIGRIEIFEEFSTVDLPEGMPKDILNILQKVVVSGKRLNISKFKKERSESSTRDTQNSRRRPKARPKGRRKGKNKRDSKK